MMQVSMGSNHLLVVLAVLGVVTSLALLIAVFRVRRTGARVLWMLLAVVTLSPAGLVVLSTFPEWVDGRFRTFKAFYADIQPGMTRGEVLAVQARHYPESGARQRPRTFVDDADRLVFFMHPEVEGSHCNVEAIVLGLEHGLVSSKTYAPD